MTFATPALAGIVAAIAIPSLIILYFLKLRRRDVEISSTLLWKKAIEDLQANAPFQKLRRNILLLLQLLALAAILLALAQPEFKDTGVSNQRQIILIDRSASMSAADAGSGETRAARLDEAKRRALELVDGLREPGFFNERGDEAMVIAFDSAAEVRQSFTTNKSELRRAIEAITPTDAPSSLDRAFSLAKAYTGTKKFEDQIQENRGFVAQAPGATIHLFSDGRLPDAPRIQTGLEDSVVFHAVGAADTTNVGITGLRAERAFDNPSRVSVFVGLTNTAPQPRTVEVELAIDGTIVAISDTTVAAAAEPPASAGATAEGAGDPPPRPRPGIGGLVFPVERSQGGVATVRIVPKSGAPDALPTDNTAYLVIPPARRLSVALVTSGNFFIRPALEGMHLSRLDVVSPSAFQDAFDKGQTAQWDVFVFDRVLPEVKAAAPDLPTPAPAATGDTPPVPGSPAPAPAPGAPADPQRRHGLPPGRSLVIGAVPPPPLGVVDQGTTGPAVYVSYQRDHPVLRLTNLDKVNIGKNRKVEIAPDSPVRALATTNEGPSILEVTDSSVHAIVVPFDVTDTDWPFDPGWVLFLVNSTLYLAEQGTGGEVGNMVRAGDTLSTRLPRGATEVRISLPDGQRVPLEPAADGSVVFGPIARNGVYTVSWSGQATSADDVDDGRARRAFAANLLDPEESDVAAVEKLAMAREIVSAQPSREIALTRRLWPWLLLVALGVVMLEWFVYNRKVSL